MNSLSAIARLLIPCCAAALVLSGCDSGTANAVAQGETPAIPVEVAEVERGSITAFYSTTATLEADREARVVPRLGGTIVELFAEEGDTVTEGQLLARIDADRYRLELKRNEATLQRLEQDFNRHREMQERNLISLEAFERAKFEYESHRAQVELSRLDLFHTAIRSPIAGVVSRRLIKVGNTVNTQEEAFVVTSLDPLLAVLHVPERELSRLAVGQPALIGADAVPGHRFEGGVARISPVIDAATGTFRVTVEVGGEDTPLKPGMFARVNVVHDVRSDVLLVPVQAVIAEDARTYLFIVRDGVAERRDVRTGYRDNGKVEVSAGLSEGEHVVVTGQAALRNDSKVQIIGGTIDQTSRS
jgi:membrane fusion protein, multidrug efflux system